MYKIKIVFINILLTRYHIKIEDVIKDIPISSSHHIYTNCQQNPYITYETVSKEDFRQLIDYFEISPYADLFIGVTIRKL